jgi:hypothetical protein
MKLCEDPDCIYYTGLGSLKCNDCAERKKGAGNKYDQGKPRLSLIPQSALIDVAQVLEVGAKKYSRDNWKVVPDATERYTEALLRHASEVADGLSVDDDPFREDPESGLPHLAHVACNALFLLWFRSQSDE